MTEQSSEGGGEGLACICPTDDYCPKCHPRWYAKWVEAERDKLQRWKDEALPVILGLQDLGKALGLRLGKSITGPDAVEAARNMHARTESAEAERDAALAALANAWDEGYEEAIGDTEARSAPPGPNGPVDPTRNPYRAAVEGGRS